jgi:hypothetical protein
MIAPAFCQATLLLEALNNRPSSQESVDVNRKLPQPIDNKGRAGRNHAPPPVIMLRLT